MTPETLANHLEGLFSNEHNGWHTPVTKALTDISADLAGWRPSAGMYSIWDLVNHMAYEQQTVLNCVLGRADKVEPFSPPGPRGYPNWPGPGAGLGADGWQVDLDRLLHGHRTLVEALRGLTPEQITAPAPGRRVQLYKLVQGLIGHNSYHCGQIILLRRLCGAWQEWVPT